METKSYENEDFFRLVEIELEECGKVRIKVRGFSMQPIIRNGRDTVMLEQVKDNNPIKGQIYLFRYNGRHILHRYIDDKDGMMVMRGDNLFSYEYCKPNDLVGIVRSICHNGCDISPTSLKWKIITSIHRTYKRVRMYGGKILRLLGLR